MRVLIALDARLHLGPEILIIMRVQVTPTRIEMIYLRAHQVNSLFFFSLSLPFPVLRTGCRTRQQLSKESSSFRAYRLNLATTCTRGTIF